MIRQVLLVGLGGFLGSVLRFLLSKFNDNINFFGLPIGTLFVNIVGSLLIGLLAGIFVKELGNHHLKFLLATGFCGGFTTFSTFSLENLSLFQSGQTTTAILYIFVSLILGLLAVMLGYWFSQFIVKA